MGRSWTATSITVLLRSIPDGVESVDVTFAVQQTRTVEFLVRPTLPPPQ